MAAMPLSPHSDGLKLLHISAAHCTSHFHDRFGRIFPTERGALSSHVSLPTTGVIVITMRTESLDWFGARPFYDATPLPPS